MCHKLHKGAIVHAAAILPNRSGRRQPIQFSGPRPLKRLSGSGCHCWRSRWRLSGWAGMHRSRFAGPEHTADGQFRPGRRPFPPPRRRVQAPGRPRSQRSHRRRSRDPSHEPVPAAGQICRPPATLHRRARVAVVELSRSRSGSRRPPIGSRAILPDPSGRAAWIGTRRSRRGRRSTPPGSSDPACTGGAWGCGIRRSWHGPSTCRGSARLMENVHFGVSDRRQYTPDCLHVGDLYSRPLLWASRKGRSAPLWRSETRNCRFFRRFLTHLAIPLPSCAKYRDLSVVVLHIEPPPTYGSGISRERCSRFVRHPGKWWRCSVAAYPC